MPKNLKFQTSDQNLLNFGISFKKLLYNLNYFYIFGHSFNMIKPNLQTINGKTPKIERKRVIVLVGQ